MGGLPDGVPGYWMHETSGVLRPAVSRKSPLAISLAYLDVGEMSAEHVAAMRAYLRQWIDAPAWRGFIVDDLRRLVDGLTSRRAIREWLDLADEAGIDPL